MKYKNNTKKENIMKTLDTIFKSYTPRDDWSKIEEEQACIVVSEFWDVHAGYYEEPELYGEEPESFDLQACHKLNDDGKTWDRVGGREGMSFCECWVEDITHVFVPKEDLDPGLVCEILQNGYKIYDRLLRPAMVGVSKSKQDQKSDD